MCQVCQIVFSLFFLKVKSELRKLLVPVHTIVQRSWTEVVYRSWARRDVIHVPFRWPLPFCHITYSFQVGDAWKRIVQLQIFSFTTWILWGHHTNWCLQVLTFFQFNWPGYSDGYVSVKKRLSRTWNRSHFLEVNDQLGKRMETISCTNMHINRTWNNMDIHRILNI